MNMENGMAMLTSMALRTPMTKNRTTTTRIRPVMMLFSRSETIMRMSLAWSISLVISVPAGQVWRLASIILVTSDMITRIFSPAIQLAFGVSLVT